MDSLSLPELDLLVKSNIWRGNPMMMSEIFDRYVTLILEQGPYPNFGTAEYWDEYLGPDDEQTGGAPSYTFSEWDRIYVKKFGQLARFFNVRFLNDDEPCDTVRQVLDTAIATAFKEGSKKAQVGLEFRHGDLKKPIQVPFSTRQKMTTDNVMNLLEAILQSAATVKVGAAMEIKTVLADFPQAGGRTKGIRLLGNKAPCIGIIDNTDSMCVPRSIVYAVARLEKDTDEEGRLYWQRIRQGDRKNRTTQGNAARDLLQRAGIPADTLCGIPELEKLQAVLPGYQIKAWNLNLHLFYESKVVEEKKIYLLFDGDHCNPINSITMFMDRAYFCESCNVGYNSKTNHRCENICKYCLRVGGDCARDGWVKCDDCARRFPSRACFDNHKTLQGRQQHTVCQDLYICSGCNSQVRRKEKHHCGKQRCPSCGQYDFAEGHQWRCYMQKIEKEEDTPKKKKRKKAIKSFIFFDFESRQDEKFDEGSSRHRVNYCVVQKVCDDCQADWSADGECTNCGDRQLTFAGDDCVEKFAEWLFVPDHQQCVVMAHNFSGYDGQFLLAYAVEKGLTPKIIPRGLSVMSMFIQGIKFLDSFLFLPMALAALPKAYGFADKVLKGYFPHLFNTAENQDYVGPIPDVSYYTPDSMKPEAHQKFMEWYGQQGESVFDFRQELHNYCVDDVTILRRAALEFRRIFVESTGVDPFESSVTIASACSIVLRRHFIDEEMVGIIPHEGYRRNDKQSAVAVQWLKWVSHSRGIDIQHARNIGEKKIGPYKVDGFCAAENKVYEYHGCYFHGCSCILTRDGKAAGSDLTLDEAYNRTLARKEYFEKCGYQYEEIWGCEYDRQLKENDEMFDYIQTLDIVLPLDPREGFFGGRTNAIVLEKKAGDGERIEYADVVSLYPTMLKKRPFPLGHPTIVTENFEPITADHNPYFGMIKCEVLPPRRLFHPVLPARIGKKLMFPLCRTCAALSQPDCTHTEEERILKGVWPTIELELALEKGYELKKVHEVWHYHRKSDPNDTSKFFGGYVDTFLKLKAEASGYPSWAVTDDDKDAFVRDFYEKEGVLLDKTKIAKNAGQRYVAKLCLNSIWGKFGQRNNLPNCVFVSEYEEYYRLMHDPSIEVMGTVITGEEVLCMNYRVRDAYAHALPNTNTVIAAFTTAWARKELYGYLDKLDTRVLYFDTDSVVYTVCAGDWRPTFGEKLGEMTNELEKDYGEGAYCDHFLGAGAKHYALSIVNGENQHYIVKVRGFTQNKGASRKINFENMRKMIAQFLKPQADGLNKLRIDFPQITRTVDHEVITREAHKDYRVVYDKRRVFADGTTLPWGY